MGRPQWGCEPKHGIGLTRLLRARRENPEPWVPPARRVPWGRRVLLASRDQMVSGVCRARW